MITSRPIGSSNGVTRTSAPAARAARVAPSRSVTGYLVTDLDGATRAARAAGADVLVTPFDDPIGRDVIIQWPGGVNMQLYWHTTPPSYPGLQTIPENRVYVSADRAAALLRSFSTFSHGKV